MWLTSYDVKVDLILSNSQRGQSASEGWPESWPPSHQVQICVLPNVSGYLWHVNLLHLWCVHVGQIMWEIYQHTPGVGKSESHPQENVEFTFGEGTKSTHPLSDDGWRSLVLNKQCDVTYETFLCFSFVMNGNNITYVMLSPFIAN